MDTSRIDDLRRRVQQDPASIAFAQLAEELRRAGQFQESIDVASRGLVLHSGYVSARVTLGRALLQLGTLDAARQELELVRQTAPDNLAAIRALAELHRARGEHDAALTYLRRALGLAPNDPELERLVDVLGRQVALAVDAQTAACASQQLAALGQWLAAIHVSRTQRHA